MATKQKQKTLTKKQRERMAHDRVQELCAMLGLEEVEDDAFDEAQAFVLELYDADTESGKALA